MKPISLIVILGLVSLISCSQVLNLTDQNFNQTILANKYVMVKFFAPWCGHCKTIAPEFEKLAELAKDSSDVVIGQVDATISILVAQKYNIKGYPTIKLFINGVDIDYTGQRTAQEMYGWIKKVSETVLKQISFEKIDELKVKQNLMVYFGSDQAKTKTVELLNIADSGMDYFVSPDSRDALVLYPLGKEPVEFPSNLPFTAEQIRQWSVVYTIPTVVPLSSKQYLDWVFYDEKTMKDVVMLLREDDITEETYKSFQKLCGQNKEQFKCCVVDSTHQVYNGVKNYLRASGKSVLAMTKDALKQAYAYPNNINELSEQSWKQFLVEVDAGTLKNLAASESDKIEYSNVKTLTEANFTSFIKENEIVFVEFYTTTCPHCVEFAKVYEELAKKVYNDESLGYEITAVDAKKSKQVTIDMKVTSYPTLLLFVNGHKVLYEGPRTTEAILNFIKSAKDSKPITAGSIAEIPSPSVVIYDPSETTSLKLLPLLFTRYPVYHIREGQQLKIVLREQTEQVYSGELVLEDVSKWLYKKTDPVLVNLLNTNIDNKLRQALENKIHMLGLIDVQPSLSSTLQNTLAEYCKESSLVCGYAKKEEANFPQFIQWLGVDADTVSSFVYINTESYDRYLFPKKIEELTVENIAQFTADVKEGKILSVTELKNQAAKEEQKPEETQKEETQEVKEVEETEQVEKVEEAESQVSQETQESEQTTNEQEL